VPVRIEIDAKQLAAHPLRVGLSMEATVDVAPRDGAPLLGAAAPRSSSSTQAFEPQRAQADKIVAGIIAANLGRTATHGPAQAASGAKLAVIAKSRT